MGEDALDKNEIVEMLRASDAVEWREKVGVVGNTEGSAKTVTRLLASAGLVFKTRVDMGDSNLDSIARQLRVAADTARRTPLWHKQKFWFALRVGDVFFPVSACPQLHVLRRIEHLDARMQALGRMFAWGLEVAQRYEVGLDLNPSNFAIDDGRLYYLDDELYQPLSPRDIGAAIAARIAEEEDLGAERWRAIGVRFAEHLRRWLRGRSEWDQLEEGLLDYPLVMHFGAGRDSLLDGMRTVANPPRRTRENPQLTCLLADVHANLPALEAVLAETQRLGVTDYLFLGDAVGYGPHPRECVRRLAGLPGLVAVRGNHDHVALRDTPGSGMNSTARVAIRWTSAQLGESERSWLDALPRETGGIGWLAVHGAPRDPERFFAYVYEMTFRENLSVLREYELRVCFYGHTHVQFVHRDPGEGEVEKLGATDVSVGEPNCHLLINPGSVGQPRDGDVRAGFALWSRDTDAVSFHRVDYPLEQTVRDLERAGLPRDLGNRLEVGR